MATAYRVTVEPVSRGTTGEEKLPPRPVADISEIVDYSGPACAIAAPVSGQKRYQYGETIMTLLHFAREGKDISTVQAAVEALL